MELRASTEAGLERLSRCVQAAAEKHGIHVNAFEADKYVRRDLRDRSAGGHVFKVRYLMAAGEWKGESSRPIASKVELHGAEFLSHRSADRRKTGEHHSPKELVGGSPDGTLYLVKRYQLDGDPLQKRALCRRFFPLIVQTADTIWYTLPDGYVPRASFVKHALSLSEPILRRLKIVDADHLAPSFAERLKAALLSSFGPEERLLKLYRMNGKYDQDDGVAQPDFGSAVHVEGLGMSGEDLELDAALARRLQPRGEPPDKPLAFDSPLLGALTPSQRTAATLLYADGFAFEDVCREIGLRPDQMADLLKAAAHSIAVRAPSVKMKAPALDLLAPGQLVEAVGNMLSAVPRAGLRFKTIDDRRVDLREMLQAGEGLSDEPRHEQSGADSSAARAQTSRKLQFRFSPKDT